MSTNPAHPDPPEEIGRRLLQWYAGARRTLPWRSETGVPADPWSVLVSEFLLQQTRVAVVARRFTDFMRRFPDPASMAGAPVEAVLHAWQGLGYYRRARLLHACAQAICSRHDGSVPSDPGLLRRLPGIGPYTAAAVAAIAFRHPCLPVDGNVIRVFSRLLALQDPLPVLRRQLPARVLPFVDRVAPDEAAQAWMELGSLVCLPSRPRCGDCCLRASCRARALGIAAELPRRPAPPDRPVRYAIVFLAHRSDGALLLRRRPSTGILAGMFELPGSEWLDSPPDERSLTPPVAAGWRPVAGEIRHLFTHLDLRLRLRRAEVPLATVPREGDWYPPHRIARLPLPALTRKLLRHAGMELPAEAMDARHREGDVASARERRQSRRSGA